MRSMNTRTDVTGDVHDFDFLAGAWNVVSRRLKARFAGCDDWDVYDGTSRCTPHFGGAANVDEIAFPARGFTGLTLRLFEPAQRRWSIFWANSRDGVLLPPVFGGFSGDRGVFFGDDVDDGVPVHVRYVWTREGPDAARWEQAFSRDGAAWETNWVMEFRR
jgi:hypothetical protein